MSFIYDGFHGNRHLKNVVEEIAANKCSVDARRVFCDIAEDLGTKGRLLSSLVRLCDQLADENVYPDAVNDAGAWMINSDSVSVEKPKMATPNIPGIANAPLSGFSKPLWSIGSTAARKNLVEKFARTFSQLAKIDRLVIGPPGLVGAVVPYRWSMGFVTEIAINSLACVDWLDAVLSLNPIERVWLFPGPSHATHATFLSVNIGNTIGFTIPRNLPYAIYSAPGAVNRGDYKNCELRIRPYDSELAESSSVLPLRDVVRDEFSIECLSPRQVCYEMERVLSERWRGVTFTTCKDLSGHQLEEYT